MNTPIRVAGTAFVFASSVHAQVARPSFAEPSLSPDGREVVFASGGDIWSAPSDGGEARLLVADPALDSRPLFSPDGKRIAFVSTRTGNGDVYVLDLASGSVRRVTFDDAAETLDAWRSTAARSRARRTSTSCSRSASVDA